MCTHKPLSFVITDQNQNFILRLLRSSNPISLFRLGVTLPRLGTHLLVQYLRLVCTRPRHTAALDDVLQTNLTSNLAHALSVSSSGASRAKEDVHLFQRQAFGLWEEEVDESSAAESQESEEDVLSNASV